MTDNKVALATLSLANMSVQSNYRVNEDKTQATRASAKSFKMTMSVFEIGELRHYRQSYKLHKMQNITYLYW